MKYNKLVNEILTLDSYMYKSADDNMTKEEAEQIAELLLDEVRLYGAKVHELLMRVRNN